MRKDMPEQKLQVRDVGQAGLVAPRSTLHSADDKAEISTAVNNASREI